MLWQYSRFRAFLRDPGMLMKPLLSVAGVILLCVGATFMVIYRSTMTQANEFMLILERINTVGMSVRVLDSIPEDEKLLKNETRAQIVELLLNANISTCPKLQPKQKKAAAAQ